MHPGEIVAGADLVQRLIARQFSQWAHEGLRPVQAGGTDHVLYRLGADKCVRLPRVEWAAGQAVKESVWLKTLAGRLPLRVPVQLGLGSPDCGYPWPWSVCDWIHGTNANERPPHDLIAAAEELAEFIHALRAIDPAGAPDAADHNLRGAPLALRDQRTRAALAQLDGKVDVEHALRIWQNALDAPARAGAAVLFHGDLLPGNLIVHNDKIVALIDFGGFGAGDPACDLMSAWSLFGGQSRQRFRSAVAADDAIWRRAKGHALSQAALYAPYYERSNPAGARLAMAQIQNVLADPDD
jgi:aminoglycoside phosphotransferase (APT) family kinase protein